MDLLDTIESQREALERAAESNSFDRYRQQAVSLLADGQTQRAFSVANADPKLLSDTAAIRSAGRC